MKRSVTTKTVILNIKFDRNKLTRLAETSSWLEIEDETGNEIGMDHFFQIINAQSQNDKKEHQRCSHEKHAPYLYPRICVGV